MTRSLINPPLWNLWINGWLSKWHLPKVDDLKASHLQPTTTTTTTTRRRRRRRIYTLKIGKDLGPSNDWECPCPTQRKYQLKKVRNPYKNAAISNWTGIALHVLQWSPCGEKVGGKKHFSKSCCLFQTYGKLWILFLLVTDSEGKTGFRANISRNTGPRHLPEDGRSVLFKQGQAQPRWLLLQQASVIGSKFC